MPYNTNEDLFSSPDPLNDSIIFSSPAKANITRNRRSLPLQGSSPRKQTFQLDVGDQLSPQKIRVTVEADHSGKSRIGGQRGTIARHSPSSSPHRAPAVCQNIRTTTTTVPVKGLSDSEDDSFDSASEKPVRGRGRPRKSVGTPLPEKSRNRAVIPFTKPSPRRRRTLGHLVDGDDPEDWDFAIGAGVEVSRGKGRSRSRSVKDRTQSKSTPAGKPTTSPDKLRSSTTTREGRGRRKTLTPEEIIIHEDKIDLISNAGLNGNAKGSDTNGVLAQRDMNLVSTGSVYLSPNSIALLGDKYPDVQHDKFSPAKKNPAKATWSAPRSDPAEIKLSAGSLADTAAGSAKALVKSTLQPVANSDERDFDCLETSQENQNEIEEIREFDTILESEGFSMISVDSVPSLREHLSSPFGPNQNGMKNEPSAAKRNVQSLGNDKLALDEDSFSSIAPEILEAATPRRKPSSTLLRAVLSANVPRHEDSMASIPPETPAATTPKRQTTNKRFLSAELQDEKFNDDSFSSIPPAILEAATPAKHIPAKIPSSKAPSEPNEALEAVSKLAIASSLRSIHIGKQSLTSSGLLTPNETPSPVEMASQQPEMSDHNDDEALSEPESCRLPLPEEPTIENCQMRSSPPSVASPRFVNAANSRRSNLLHADNLETPSIAFSSPTLPPLIQPMLIDRSVMSSKLDPNQPPRPPLSPIVRAGRVLQDITTKSTLRNRTQSLGSPFKSPAAQRNAPETAVDYCGISGVSEKSQRSPEKGKGKEIDLFRGFSDSTRRELQKSMMIGEELARSQKGEVSVNAPTVAQEEDPFHSENRPIRLCSHDETKNYTLELPNYKPRDYTGLAKEEHQHNSSVHSDSAMSWQAESTMPVQISSADVSNIGNTGNVETTELFQQRREAEWTRERAVVSSQIESASPSKVIVIESDGEEEAVDWNDEVDETKEDIWQAEARHSSSILEEQSRKLPLNQEELEKPRRSKIPSPWRKNSKRLVYSDELLPLSLEHPKTINDIPSNAQVKPGRRPAHITARKRVSPRDICEDEDDLPESSIMWHIPQKSNFAPRPRNSGNLDLSALLGSSPFKRPQQVPSNTGLPVLTMPRDSNLHHPNTEVRAPSSSTSPEVGSQTPIEKSQSADKNLRDERIVNSTNASYEVSELGSEPSYVETRVCYPNLANVTSLSPQKSCLRTPTSDSPTKSVAFVSPTPSPPSAPTLSATTWSKAHWKSLHSIYNATKLLTVSQTKPELEHCNGANHEMRGSVAEPSKYLGKTIQAQGKKLTLEQWHLDIVQEFRENVPGWDEGVIAKRLFAIIVGEDLRKQSKK